MHGPAVGVQCPALHSACGPSCGSYSELASQPGLGGREAVSLTAIEQREEAAGMAAFEKALEKNLPFVCFACFCLDAGEQVERGSRCWKQKGLTPCAFCFSS